MLLLYILIVSVFLSRWRIFDEKFLQLYNRDHNSLWHQVLC